eukprot:TRINITY_DN2193_c0_g1_i11.p1 TRINITY_DN2193_c0_g1~~TRINITY_DN2193_c0_g1_i11.p1  ORF type:complete len:595 (+),score=223.18 TRINITY_DN2193_c0_g1_i11:47-1831(+)
MGNGGKWKAKSKRTSTKMRTKIEKKVRDHHKKLKKEKKKHPEKFKKSRKDPGIPNECPFKDKVLSEAKEMVARREEAKEKRRLELKELRKQSKENKVAQLRGQSYESLVANAQQKNAMFEKSQGIQESAAEKGLSDKSAKAYYKEFRKVVEAADVILEVLDARDPMGSRCREVEEAVMAGGRAGKRLVLVLNKADLVPKENLLAWIKYLRNEYPTIPFKASTQQTARLGHAKINMKQVEQQITTSKCVGADTLLALLGNYCRNKDIKTSIRVGVVGMPNVGKSSLINSLKRSKACNVGATPGVTKSMQEVQLDSKVKLLDCPGLVMAGGNRTDASVALRNAVKVENLDDPITPVVAILARVPRKHLMLQYRLTHFQDCAEFLALLAIQQGKLKKGGVPDREKAARIMLGDWNSGKIKYFTHPPEENAASSNLGAEIVQQFAAEFNLESLENNGMEMDTLPVVMPSDAVQVESGAMHEKALDLGEQMDDQDSDLEDAEESDGEKENAENILPDKVGIVQESRKKKSDDGEAIEDDPLFKLEGNRRIKKAAKLQQKKIKKARKRADKLGDELTDKMDSAFSALTSEDYSFKTDFTD